MEEINKKRGEIMQLIKTLAQEESHNSVICMSSFKTKAETKMWKKKK